MDEKELMEKYAKLEAKVDAGLEKLKAHAWTAAIVAGAGLFVALVLFSKTPAAM